MAWSSIAHHSMAQHKPEMTRHVMVSLCDTTSQTKLTAPITDIKDLLGWHPAVLQQGLLGSEQWPLIWAPAPLSLLGWGQKYGRLFGIWYRMGTYMYIHIYM